MQGSAATIQAGGRLSFNEVGFLSPDVQNWISKHRQESADAFRVADALNRVGVKTLYTAKAPNNDDRRIAISLLFGRVLSHYECALILCERGAVLSAKVLMRVMLEATFILAAIVKDAAFLDRYQKDDRKRGVALIRALLNLPEDRNAVPIDELEKFRQKLIDLKAEIKADEQQNFGAFEAAEHAGMLDFYRIFYVPFSNVVHTSLRDLSHHVNDDQAGEIESFKWGPDSAEVDDLVDSATQIFLTTMERTLETFPNPEASEEFQDLLGQFEDRLKEKIKRREVSTAGAARPA
jgi:hypothetical protein